MPKHAHVDLLFVEEVCDLMLDAYEAEANAIGVLLRVDQLSTHTETVDAYKAIADEYRLDGFLHLCVYETKLDPATQAETNPHYQSFFFINKSRYRALRQAIKRIWTGNDGYSLKKSVPEKAPGYFNYLCKGTGTGSDDQPQVVYASHHFTDLTLIHQLHSTYWLNEAKIQANSKKKREIPIHENVLKLCRDRGYSDLDKGKIFDVIMEYYTRRMKYLQPAYVRNLVWQTAVYLSPDGPTRGHFKDYCLACPYS